MVEPREQESNQNFRTDWKVVRERGQTIWSAHPSVSTAQRLLLFAILEYVRSNDEGKPSQGTLAKMCSWSRANLAKHLASLKSMGILTVTQGGNGDVARYCISWDKVEHPYRSLKQPDPAINESGKLESGAAVHESSDSSPLLEAEPFKSDRAAQYIQRKKVNHYRLEGGSFQRRG